MASKVTSKKRPDAIAMEYRQRLKEVLDSYTRKQAIPAEVATRQAEAAEVQDKTEDLLLERTGDPVVQEVVNYAQRR